MEGSTLYYCIKLRISELLQSLQEAVVYIGQQSKIPTQLLADCNQALSQIIKTSQQEEDAQDLVQSLQLLIGDFLQPPSPLADWTDKVCERLYKTYRILWDSVPTRWRMVFLPYNASMWSCMESLWEAADEDPQCDTYVVPIPYYTLLGDQKSNKYNYHGDMYPANVPVVDYQTIDLEKMHPEFIIIHNPYDDMNNLTRVPSKFFSSNLSKYTCCLVYSPYFTFFNHTSDIDTTNRLISAPAVANCDKVLVQSNTVKEHFIKCNIPSEKLLSLGSPKIDYIVNSIHDNRVQIPQEWKNKIGNRKRILYTFSLSCAYNPVWLEGVYNCMKTYWNDPDLGFILRPHPLVQDYCINRQRNVDLLNKIYQFAQSDERWVLDTNSDYMPAFQFSDGFMLSDSSSLINEYMATGKPIYWDHMNYDVMPATTTKKGHLFADMTVLYCPRKCVGLSDLECHYKGTDMFFSIVKGQTKDTKKEKRMYEVQRYFENVDGSAGSKIYQALVKEYIQLPQ